ncbi:hypothetical protein MKEN_00378800 [Mycena kentingensis (nom. inval.)]|nr:hypothetical protein MKEN_00378800 [Mycena kentingensis (nom. inval.)]
MSTITQAIPELDEHDGEHEEIDLDIGDPQVNFYPPLHLQRRIWILDICRREGITELLDVGCGEGQLLSVLAQPATWLSPLPDMERFSYKTEVPNLHMKRITGLDVSAADLAFAVKDTKPPSSGDADEQMYGLRVTRFEDLEVKIFKGALETMNPDFVGVECIVCTEVIEHLPPETLPALAPMLLGIYSPKRLLITTPSYTFNARFTRPSAPREQRARQGFLDPTGRTDRIFRHPDHKFEWTVDEFHAWCGQTADEWDYELEEMAGIGRPLEDDPWGRDEELGDASFVVSFRRKDGVVDRADKARRVLEALKLDGKPHELLATHHHEAHESAGKPGSTDAIAAMVKTKMEELRDAIVPLEQLWFDPAVSTLCGGFIEVLIRAVEESAGLTLLRPTEGSKEWSIEIVGGIKDAMGSFWTEGFAEADCSLDLIPDGWMPGQDPDDGYEEEDTESSSLSTTGADGDASWNGSQSENGESWGKNADAWSGPVSSWEDGGGWGEQVHSD